MRKKKVELPKRFCYKRIVCGKGPAKVQSRVKVQNSASGNLEKHLERLMNINDA